MSNLNILYQFDNNYAPIAGVSITTLLEHNQDIENLSIYIAAKDVSEDNINKFTKLSEQYHRKFIYLSVDKIYDHIQSIGGRSWNGSLATWMKMFIMSEIPSSVSEILYIDSDTLITGSLAELAELDLGDYPVACVIDSLSRKSSKRLGLIGAYFNAGLILFNLACWRKNEIEKDMIRHLEEHVKEYPVNDQDLLNDYFRGKILQLDPRYNFQGTHFAYDDETYFSVMKWKKNLYYSRNTIREARENIRIVHFFRFCGDYPWQSGTIHPCKELFIQASNDSLWRDYAYPQKQASILFQIEKRLRKILPQNLFLWLIRMVSH